VRVEHLPRVTARAVAVVGKVVGGGLAEDDRAGGAHSGDLEGVTPNDLREQPRPLGARAGRRKTVHVVDRLREDGHAIERPACSPRAQALVRRARVAGHRRGERVDRVPSRAILPAALERAGGDLRRRPVAAPASGLIVGDGAVEGVRRRERQLRQRKRGKGGKLKENFPAAG
jgi:hypothetical protein